MTARTNIYDLGLDANAANFTQLSPLSFIARTAAIYPDLAAVSYGDLRRNWAQT